MHGQIKWPLNLQQKPFKGILDRLPGCLVGFLGQSVNLSDDGVHSEYDRTGDNT